MTARSDVQLNTLSLKEWITATLSVTKTDVIKNRYPTSKEGWL